jgi:aryl-alcohol dehydrogenase-like predicted oxidoreductase
MRTVDLPVSGKGCATGLSVLGFGCSPLMGRAGRRDSLAALAAAEEAGINFFDTARSYGYGESEALLGAFLKGRRQSMIISTKFGILPSTSGWKQKVKPLAQAVIRVFPGLRKHARKQAAGQTTSGQFSVAVLRASFEASLRALQTDYVDMLLLHAAPMQVLDQDDLLEALERLVEGGKVRMAGISGDHAVIAETFRRQPRMLTTAQFALNGSCLDFTRETRQPEAQKLLLVANHPFGGPAGVSAIIDSIAAMRHAEALPADLRRKLDVNDPQLMPEILLNAILQGTGISAVLPSMMRTTSLRSNVRAVEQCRFSSEELTLLREELIRQTSPTSAATLSG